MGRKAKTMRAVLNPYKHADLQPMQKNTKLLLKTFVKNDESMHRFNGRTMSICE